MAKMMRNDGPHFALARRVPHVGATVVVRDEGVGQPPAPALVTCAHRPGDPETTLDLWIFPRLEPPRPAFEVPFGGGRPGGWDWPADVRPFVVQARREGE